jgi:type I restriction enzyme S subunit
MISEKKLLKLEDAAELVRETVPPQEALGQFYIGLEHIQEGALHLAGYGYAEDVNSTKSKFRKGDILFGKLRPYFRKVILAPFDGICSTDIWVIRAKNGVNQKFLFYWMASQEFIDEAMRGSEGTRMPRAKWDFVARQTSFITDLEEQKAIAHILGTLDDKIELNQQMNRNLEAIASAIFKSWFVDFDPVRAKMEGRQPAGMDAATAAPFPDSFENSPLGEIPKGWRVSTIGESVRVVGGSTPSTKEPAYWENGTIHWATPKDLASLSSPVIIDTERCITELGLQQISSGLLPVGTVLLSSRAPIGYLAIAEVPLAINQGFIAMICDRELSNHYVLQWTRANMDAIKGRANGTTFLEISKTNFRPLHVVVPSLKILQHFTEQATAYHQQLVNNLEQSLTLANIRDTLLPKLMSGEIRVKEAEKIVEAVA